MRRFTITDLIHASGLSAATIRKHSDKGKIPYHRDVNNWRIYDERAIEIVRELAGLPQENDEGSIIER